MENPVGNFRWQKGMHEEARQRDGNSRSGVEIPESADVVRQIQEIAVIDPVVRIMNAIEPIGIGQETEDRQQEQNHKMPVPPTSM
jgi:hypothetical protein